jgi:DNA modification methylase
MEVNKIIQGDCLDVLKTIPDESVDLVVTDPPYFISQIGNNINRRNLKAKSLRRNSDIRLDFGEWDHFDSERDFFEFTESWFKECIRVLKPKGWIYIFFDKQKMGYFDLFLAPKYGVKSRTIFVWVKTNPVPSFRKVNWVSSTEFAWVGSKGEGKIKNFLTQKEMYNYMLTANKSSYGVTAHPTEKPEAVMGRFIQASTLKGDVVLDPFMGSGTTAVAAKKLGRNYIGIEENSEYIKMAEERLTRILL